jgi:hypothetical protein
VKLTGEQYRQLHEALLSAFPDRSALEQMLYFRLEVRLDDISLGTNMRDTVFQLIRWAEAQGKVRELLDSARAQNNNNPDLIAVERILFAHTSHESVTAAVVGSGGFSVEAATGAVPLSSNFYIVRRQDNQFFTYLQRRDATIAIRGDSGTGCRSLLFRARKYAHDNGAKVALTDLNLLDPEAFVSLKDFLHNLLTSLADEMNLSVYPKEAWNDRLGNIQNLTNYMEKHVLESASAHIVWLMDNTDRLIGNAYCGQLFGVFRSWHERRNYDDVWQNLTLVIAHNAPGPAFVPSEAQSPFNVATKIELGDFTDAEIEELNRRYGNPLRDEQAKKDFIRKHGRNPRHLRVAFNHLVEGLGSG